MAIALSSKKDSSQMKSIALLTMVFLPGTFMAVSFLPPSQISDIQNTHSSPSIQTFFSMTFFEWNPDKEKGQSIVSSKIWIYFIFTGIFTLATLGLWTWFANKKRIHRKKKFT